MRIVHGSKGFDIKGLYLARAYLDDLKITKYGVKFKWPGVITIHHEEDYEKIKDKARKQED